MARYISSHFLPIPDLPHISIWDFIFTAGNVPLDDPIIFTDEKSSQNVR